MLLMISRVTEEIRGEGLEIADPLFLLLRVVRVLCGQEAVLWVFCVSSFKVTAQY